MQLKHDKLEMQDGHGDVQEVQVQGSGLQSIHIMTLACACLHGCPEKSQWGCPLIGY